MYPYYGVAPHQHDMAKTGTFLGSTVLEPPSKWPKNFRPDPEGDSCGMYYCPTCLSGMPQDLTDTEVREIPKRKPRK
jgi:hypothetical protein